MTLAVVPILMVTGWDPHENRIKPPARTAATTASLLQLAGVPCPTTWLGCVVATGRPAAGTGTEREPGAEPRGLERALGATQAAMTKRPRHAARNDVRRGIPQA